MQANKLMCHAAYPAQTLTLRTLVRDQLKRKAAAALLPQAPLREEFAASAWALPHMLCATLDSQAPSKHAHTRKRYTPDEQDALLELARHCETCGVCDGMRAQYAAMAGRGCSAETARGQPSHFMALLQRGSAPLCPLGEGIISRVGRGRDSVLAVLALQARAIADRNNVPAPQSRAMRAQAATPKECSDPNCTSDEGHLRVCNFYKRQGGGYECKRCYDRSRHAAGHVSTGHMKGPCVACGVRSAEWRRIPAAAAEMPELGEGDALCKACRCMLSKRVGKGMHIVAAMTNVIMVKRAK